MEATIVNRVAESGIITLDLTPFIPKKEDIAVFDLKPYLFREMILREKDFRAALLTCDWDQYRGKAVALTCTVDAIIPVWGYMLVAAYLQPVAASVHFGTADELIKLLIHNRINAIDLHEYADKRVVIKGCGDTPIPEAAYVAITHHLRPVVKSLMYGEPCSMVPIFKKK
jgi:hypothetical protein